MKFFQNLFSKGPRPDPEPAPVHAQPEPPEVIETTPRPTWTPIPIVAAPEPPPPPKPAAPILPQVDYRREIQDLESAIALFERMYDSNTDTAHSIYARQALAENGIALIRKTIERLSECPR